MQDIPMFFSSTVLRGVAGNCYALAWASEVEERGRSLGSGEIPEKVDLWPSDAVMIALLCRYLGRVEQAWGYSLTLVFYHMGITWERFSNKEEQEEKALTDLMLGCMGHGVTLADDWEKELLQAGKVLGRTFSPVPFHDEMDEWSELALELLDPA